MKFCLAHPPGARAARAALAFFCHDAEHARDPKRRFALPPRNWPSSTRTRAPARSSAPRADAELTTAIYRRVPVLVNEGTGQNPWGSQFPRAMFNMTNDSGLFHTEPGRVSPLYEAKLLHQFEHRWATYAGRETRDCLPAEKADPAFAVTPRYWWQARRCRRALAAAGWERGWLLGFRDITERDQRTHRHLQPLAARGRAGTMPLVILTLTLRGRWHAVFWQHLRLVMDYTTRRRWVERHMASVILKQLPLLPLGLHAGRAALHRAARPRTGLHRLGTSSRSPMTWRDADDTLRRIPKRQHEENRQADRRARGAPPEWAEIAPDGCPLPPFKWDEERRAVLRAELDAYYARLYGLNRKQLRYILDPHGLSERELEDILDPWEDPTCSGPHLLPENRRWSSRARRSGAEGEGGATVRGVPHAPAGAGRVGAAGA